jgi:hypothetical protein
MWIGCKTFRTLVPAEKCTAFFVDKSGFAGKKGGQAVSKEEFDFLSSFSCLAFFTL